MNTTMFKPKKVYLCLKYLYIAYASTLSLKIKMTILGVVALFIIDDFMGCSHLLMVNSKLDTIERFYGTKPELTQSLVSYKEELAKEFCSYSPKISIALNLFSLETRSTGRLNLYDTLSSTALFLILLLMTLGQLVRAIFRNTVKQIERIVNLSLILVILLVIVWLIATIISLLPTIANNPFINYTIYLIFNIGLYPLLWYFLLKNYAQDT